MSSNQNAISGLELHDNANYGSNHMANSSSNRISQPSNMTQGPGAAGRKIVASAASGHLAHSQRLVAQVESEQNLNAQPFSENQTEEKSKRDLSKAQFQKNQQSNQIQLTLEDEELKKKIALYYHQLFQGCLGQWFVLLQQRNYTKLTKQQYIELNMRIQKSLILDFDYESAYESALEDWKIDIERETFDNKHGTNQGAGGPAAQKTLTSDGRQQLQQINEEDDMENNGTTNKKYLGGAADSISEREDLSPSNSQLPRTADEPHLIDYERLSEFFFDLCLSWCQYLDIETFLFFLNGIFLNITQGSHVNVSTFKPLGEIEVLSIEFFNTLLTNRSNQERIQEQAAANNGVGESYKDWYNRNFSRQGEIVRSVEKQLFEAFKERQENRILDLWIDLPTQSQNHYINQHFDKLDKDFKQMQKASKATELLTNSMNLMDQIKKINLNDKTKKPGDTSKFSQPGQESSRAFQNNNISLAQYDKTKRTTGLMTGQHTLNIKNTKEIRQNEIESHLVGQLGDRFQHAKLIEISENSYLIQANVRLPVFGRPYELIERTKTSISKRGYLLKMHPEYTAQNRRNIIEQRQQRQNHHLIVHNKDLQSLQGALPTSSNNIMSDGNSQASGLIMKNVVYEKVRARPGHNPSSDLKQQSVSNPAISPHQPGQPMNFQNRRDSLPKDTLDSESDPHVGQHHLQHQMLSFEDKQPLAPGGQTQTQGHHHQKMLLHQYSEEHQKSGLGGLNVKMPELVPQTQMSSLAANRDGQTMGGSAGYPGYGLNQTINNNNNMAEDSSSANALGGQFPQQYNNNSSLLNNTLSHNQQAYNSQLSGSQGLPYQPQFTQQSNNMEERFINQVYERYLHLLQQEDQQTAPPMINDILQEEHFARELNGLNLDEVQVEQAVLEKLHAEEESAEIQEMIAKFYNKFDELHEQSVAMALARSPNKQQVKNEIKYKIPERWTKPFHRHDIIPLGNLHHSAVLNERGRVNRRQGVGPAADQSQIHKSKTRKEKPKLDMSLASGNGKSGVDGVINNSMRIERDHYQQQQEQQQKLAMIQQQQIQAGVSPRAQQMMMADQQQEQDALSQQQALMQQIPLSNSMLKESLSSRATPKSEYKRRQRTSEMQQMFNQQSTGFIQQPQVPTMIFKNTHVNEMHQQQQLQDVSSPLHSQQPVQRLNQSHQNFNTGGAAMLGRIDDMIGAESTDVSKAGDHTGRHSTAASDFNKSSGLCKPQYYDWSEVAHLFEGGVVPEELLSISDPIEYNYILVRMKKDFNEKNKSEYIKYMNLQLPYHSRRDEVGGVITLEEWGNFVNRLEGIIDKVQKRRRRIIRRRKKKGIKKLPRKTLFKPVARPNLANDPLWKEVFLESSGSDEEDESEDEGQEQGFNSANKDKDKDDFDIYQLGLKGFGSQKSSVGTFQKNAAQILGLNGAEGGKKPRASTGTAKNGAKGNKTHHGGNMDFTAEELSLPPIMRPLLYEDFKTSGRQKASAGKLRTASMNLKETIDKYPESKNMLNMRLKDQYFDPFDKEPHKASRVVRDEMATVQKMEHTYKHKIKRTNNNQKQELATSLLNQSKLTPNMQEYERAAGPTEKKMAQRRPSGKVKYLDQIQHSAIILHK